MAQITLNSTGVASDGALALQSNGTTTAVTISTAQNVGIGTASPARLLSLSAASPILRMTETGANSDLDFIVSTNSGGLNISVDANNEGANSFCAVSVDGTERMRIDSSGNVGIGTSSPSYPLDVVGATNSIYTRLGSSGRGLVFSQFQTSSVDNAGHLINASSGVGVLAFATNSTERARIDSSGNLLVGTTNNDPKASAVTGVVIRPTNIEVSTSGTGGFFNRISGTGTMFSFRQANNVVGSIDVTASATSYVTSSDYRLKESIAPMTGALAKVSLLKPCIYKWKVDGLDGQGFIAHELQEVCPDAVTGEKDGEQMQGVDYGKLTPILTAALQEAIAKIETLEARIAVLEAK